MNRNTISSLRVIDLQQHARDGGVLTVIPDTGSNGLGITVRRVFTVTDVPSGGVRGDHAHRDCTQVVVCLQGSVSIRVDDGKEAVTVLLDNASKALSIPPGLWNHLTFAGPETVIAVFCDQPYTDADYLRDRSAYMIYKGVHP